MLEVRQCDVVAGRGLDVENRKAGKREITLLSLDKWSETCNELGAVISWHARRANLLVEGLDLAATIGDTLAIGDVRIKIHMESTPCGLMDEQYPGLRAALKADCRGGVAGQVLAGGTIRIGDGVLVNPS